MNPPLVDTHVTLDRWPFRRIVGDAPEKLAEQLRTEGVERAWASSFEGVFQRDLEGVHERLAQTCRTTGDGLFEPIGVLNPRLPDWRTDVARIIDKHRFRGVRLYPGYHGYRLDDPLFAELLDVLAAAKLFVQLAVMIEDERTQSHLARAAPVALGPLADLMHARPGLRLQLLNPFRGNSLDLIAATVAAGDVYVDVANLEGVGGLENVLQKLPLERVLFGSHAPFFYFVAARLKLRESPLTEDQRSAIAHRNAQSLLK